MALSSHTSQQSLFILFLRVWLVLWLLLGEMNQFNEESNPQSKTKTSSRKEQKAGDRTCSSEQSLQLSADSTSLTDRLRPTDRLKRVCYSASTLQRSVTGSSFQSIVLHAKAKGTDHAEQAAVWHWLNLLAGAITKARCFLPHKKAVSFT